jgi:hypothetical protein
MGRPRDREPIGDGARALGLRGGMRNSVSQNSPPTSELLPLSTELSWLERCVRNVPSICYHSSPCQRGAGRPALLRLAAETVGRGDTVWSSKR